MGGEIIENRLILSRAHTTSFDISQINQIALKIPCRLLDDVVHRIPIRLSALEPVLSIAAAVGIAHETVLDAA